MSRLKPYLLSIALHALLVAAIVFFGVREWRETEETPQALALEGRLVRGAPVGALAAGGGGAEDAAVEARDGVAELGLERRQQRWRGGGGGWWCC